jgi:signal transduction histidine kinase
MKKQNLTKLIQLILPCIFILSFYGFAKGIPQNNEDHIIDSLKTITRIEPDLKQRVHNYNEIAYHYGSINVDSTFFFIKKAMAIADSLNYKKGMAESHLYMARASAQEGMLNEGIENFHLALDLFVEQKDSSNILMAYRGLAYVSSYSANQLTNLDYNLKALSLAEQLKDSASISVMFNNIAAVYKKLENYESAISYFQKSLKLGQTFGSIEDNAITSSNIGVLKVETGRAEDAKQDYSRLNKLLPDIDNIYLKSYFQLSLAAYYTAIAKYDSAQYCIHAAEEFCSTNNFPHIQARAFRRTGEMLYKQKKYSESVRAFDKCIELSNAIGIAEEFPKMYKMQAEAYEQLNLFKSAYHCMQQSSTYTDSFKYNKTTQALSEFEKKQKIRLEQERQNLEQELLAQQAENENIRLHSKLRITGITVVLLLLSVILFVYFFLKIKNKNTVLHSQHVLINEQKELLEKNIEKLQESETNLQKINSTKDKFFSIIGHDLRSPFNSILGFSNELHENYSTYNDDEKRQFIGLISKSSESAFFLLENLLNWARSQGNSVRLNKNLHPLKELVEESISPYRVSAELKSLHIRNLIPAETTFCGDKETIKIVFANLFNNAIKFTNLGEEIIFTSQLAQKQVEICIQDSGIGMSPEMVKNLFSLETNTQRNGTSHEKGTGLGLVLCQEFIHMNKGQIWVESEEEKGSKFYISLPIAEN